MAGSSRLPTRRFLDSFVIPCDNNCDQALALLLGRVLSYVWAWEDAFPSLRRRKENGGIIKPAPILLALTAVGAAALLTFRAADAPRPLPVYAHWPFPMSVSPNGRYIASVGGRTDAIELYDTRTGKTRTLTTTGVTQFYQYQMSAQALAFSPDSSMLVHGGGEYSTDYSLLNTWDTASGTHRKTFSFTSVGHSVVYTPDGREVVGGSLDGISTVWPDGRKVLAGSPNNVVRVWDARTGRSLRTLPGLGGSVVSLAISPDGRHIALGGSVPRCLLQVRDLRTGRALWTIPVPREGEVPSLAFSPDGRMLARGGQNNTIYLHDAQTGRLRATLSDPVPLNLKNWSGSDAARVLSYSPDGRYLAGAGVYRIVVWSTRTRHVAYRPTGAGEPFAFLPDSHTLAATLSDIPASHPPGARSFLMHPLRRTGNVSLWTLK